VLTGNHNLASTICNDIIALSGFVLLTLIKGDASLRCWRLNKDYLLAWKYLLYNACCLQKSATDMPLISCCSMMVCHSLELRLAIFDFDDDQSWYFVLPDN